MTKLAAIAAMCLAGRMTPLWINPNQGKDLTPPPEVMKLGDTRSADNLRAIAKTLGYSTSKRYQPTDVTFCNIATSDFCHIAKAPMPHWFEGEEMRANMMHDELLDPASKYAPGWTKTGTIASELAVRNLAQVGIPQVAVWKNPTGGPGHIMPIIPTPEGKTGIWVVGAGRHCTDGCPIADQFGKYLKDTQFFAFNGK